MLLPLLRRTHCRWRGHNRDARAAYCKRCKRTDEELATGPISKSDYALAEARTEAYWKGVEAGRKIDRRRAYRLGYMRGWKASLRALDAAITKREDAQ